MSQLTDFDGFALYGALDAKRASMGMSWPQAAEDIWKQSYALNKLRHDHPISPSTIAWMAKNGDTSCQHALFFLRWLGRSPESFTPGG